MKVKAPNNTGTRGGGIWGREGADKVKKRRKQQNMEQDPLLWS